jgi:hypothetical protein
VEEQRALFESSRERQMYDERYGVSQIDIVRLKAEREFIVWLNSEDQLQRFKEQEAIRREGKEEQKKRILRRELSRAEEKIRKEVLVEEAMTRQTIVTRCVVIAKHKAQQIAANAAARQVDPNASRHRRQSPKRSSPIRASSNRRAAASDARTEAVLTDFALSRARAFEAYFPATPEPVPTSFSARAKAWDERQRQHPVSRSSPYRAKELFERSKNRWERQEEWLDTREAALARAHGLQPDAGADAAPTNAFSGPYRTPQAAVSDLQQRVPENPLLRPTLATPADPPRGYSAPQFASPTPGSQANATANPIRSVYEEPTWLRTAGRLTPGQMRQERHLQDAIDWESVFHERMW